MAEFQHQLQPENENLVNSCVTSAGPWRSEIFRIHGHSFCIGSIGHYLVKHPMPLDELKRKQYCRESVCFNLDPSFYRLNIKSKEWHQAVTSDLRVQMICKICEGIFSKKLIDEFFQTKSHIMAANARVYEGEAYAMANSISDYYNLLDDRIYIIEKKTGQSLHERRQERNEQQLAQQQQQQQANMVGSTREQSPHQQIPQGDIVSAGQGSPMINAGNISGNVIVNVGGQESGMAQQTQPPAPADSSNSKTTNMQSPPDYHEDDFKSKWNEKTEIKLGLPVYETITPDLRVPKTKEWHLKISLLLRKTIINEILNQLFPTHDRYKWFYIGSYNIYAFARRVEADSYERAYSKTEYYQLLAEKIHNIERNREGELKRICVVQQQQLPLSKTKEWHQSVSPNSRTHFVHHVVQAIIVTKPVPFNFESLDDFVKYVQQIESSIYIMANSRHEYYQLMTIKSYEIQKEYHEKRRKHAHQLAQQRQSQQHLLETWNEMEVRSLIIKTFRQCRLLDTEFTNNQ